MPSTLWRLHDLVVEAVTDDRAIGDRWQQAFGSLPAAVGVADLRIELAAVAALPVAPGRPADFRQGEVIGYWVDGARVLARLPRFAQLELDLAGATTRGVLLPAAAADPAAFEDLVAIALSPHLRRRGRFLVHAFAAERRGRAALLVGPIGAGKTTTGLALLRAGWRLLANDSPLLARGGRVLSYPGQIAATRDSLVRLGLAPGAAAAAGKLRIEPESIRPGIWVRQAVAGAVILVGLGAGEDHQLARLTPPAALRELLPHSIEQWDRATTPAHLEVLRELVEAAPAWRLWLGPGVATLPELIESVLGG